MMSFECFPWKLKLQILLFLAIIPMLTPVFAEEMMILTDKSKYYSGDIVTVFGTSDEINKYFDFWMYDIEARINYQGASHTDGNGNFMFTNSPEYPLVTGTYEVELEIERYETPIAYFDYYAESESSLDVQTDKLEYYGGEDIFITGFTNQTDATQITLDCYYTNGTQMIPTYSTDIKSDGTFEFMLHTTDSTWANHSGYVIVNATTTDYWNSYVFHYTYKPDTTGETLLQYIKELEVRLAKLES